MGNHKRSESVIGNRLKKKKNKTEAGDHIRGGSLQISVSN